MCVPVLGATASARTSTLFTGQLRALGASATGCGRMLYLTDYRQHLSRVSVQREAMLGPSCNAACFRGVPQRRVAARLVAGYAGPDETVLLSRSRNLRCKLQIGSAKPDHYRGSRLGLPRGDF